MQLSNFSQEVISTSLSEAQRFLDVLAPNERFMFQTFDDRPEKRPELAKVVIGTLAECRDELLRLNRLGAAVSVTVNRTTGGRKATNVRDVRALFVDLDDVGLNKLQAVALDPHIIVESSPGRHHGYYLLAKEFPLAEWPLLERALVRRCHGDPAAAHNAVCLRVPGFFHRKAEPFRVRLLDVSEHPPYDFNAVRAALGTDVEALREEARARAERTKLAVGHRLEAGEITKRHRSYATTVLRKEVEALRTTSEGERNAQLNRAAFSLGTLVAAGVLEEEQVEGALTEAALDAGLERNEIAATLHSGLCAGMLAPRDLSHLATRMVPGEKPPAMLGDLRKTKDFRKVWNREAPYGVAAKRDDFALVCEMLKKRAAATDQDLCDVLFAFSKTAPDSVDYRGEVPADQKEWGDYAQQVIDSARRALKDREREEAAQSDNLTKFLRGFVYLVDGERFVDLETAASFSTKSFAILAERKCPGVLDIPVSKAFAQRQNKILLHDTYLPGLPRIVESTDKNGARNELLNLYTPPRLPEPKSNTDLERRFLEHIDMISGRSPVFVEYLLNFLATLIQQPGQRINSSPALISPATGTGKTFLKDLMQELLGKNNVGEMTTAGLQSQFHDMLMRSQLMIIEEIKVHEGTLSLMDTLKPYITNARISINRKGLPMVVVDNVSNWIFFSNHEDALRPDPQERRYCVAINREPANSEDYFNLLYKKLLSEEGIAAILYYLKNRDLTRFNPYAPAPKTEARQDMLETSYTAIERLLAEGVENKTAGGLEFDLLTLEELRDYYQQADQTVNKMRFNEPKEPHPNQVARAFKKIGSVNLGQKRLGDGSKQRVWAIRNTEAWQKAPESCIANHLDLKWAQLKVLSAEAEFKKVEPNVHSATKRGGERGGPGRG